MASLLALLDEFRSYLVPNFGAKLLVVSKPGICIESAPAFGNIGLGGLGLAFETAALGLAFCCSLAAEEEDEGVRPYTKRKVRRNV